MTDRYGHLATFARPTLESNRGWSRSAFAERLGVDPVRVEQPAGERRLSLTEWERNYDRDDAFFELLDGIYVRKILHAENSGLAGDLATLWIMAAEAERVASGEEWERLVVLPGDCGVATVRDGLIPNLSVVRRKAMLAAGRQNWTAPEPILVVELLAPEHTARELRRKRTDYLQSGVQEVWVADPNGMTVEVWTSNVRPSVYGGEDAIPCDRLFAGLRVPVRDWLRGRLVRRVRELTDAMTGHEAEPPPA